MSIKTGEILIIVRKEDNGKQNEVETTIIWELLLIYLQDGG